MMKDPQHAMEQMQAMGAADPAATQQRALAVKTRYDEVKAGDKRFIAEYQAAKKAMLEPTRTRAQALRKRADSQSVHTAEGDMWPEWAYQIVTQARPGGQSRGKSGWSIGAPGGSSFVRPGKSGEVTQRLGA